MTTAVSNAMYPVTIPCFGPASSNATNGNGGDTDYGQGGGDPLDFDLLAEYLLDDFTMAATPTAYSALAFYDGKELDGSNHSSNKEKQPILVDNDQFAAASASFADPLADAAFMYQQTGTAPCGDIAGDLLAQTQQLPPPCTPAPVPSTSIPANTPLPAPLTHPGMPEPSHPGENLNAVSGNPEMIVHHHPPRNGPDPAVSAGVKRPFPAPAAAAVVTASGPAPAVPTTVTPTIPGATIPAPKGKRQKSQAQIDRRRERNRILARRTRLRKKFFFESLQKEVMELQRENAVLRDIVKTKMDTETSQKVLEECGATELPSVVMESCGEDPLGEGGNLDKQDFNLVCSIKSQQCFVITDPSLHDNPIVYASDDFLTLTGYSRNEVLGRNCRFWQGSQTNTEKVEQIGKALEVGDDVGVCFVNHRADGTAFWNKLFIAALRDTNNNVVNFIGVTVKVAGPPPDDPEAGKLLPGEKEKEKVLPSEGTSEAKGQDQDNGATSAGAIDVEGTVAAMEGAVSAAVAAFPALPQSAPPS